MGARRPDLFIKIPGTAAGIPAIEETIFAGVPVNVTLLFSREQYVAAAEAYLRGIERWIALYFGVREHAVGAIVNGMAVHRCLIPHGATFLVFSDYMRPPIRLATMNRLPVIYVFTHDGIGMGEDGPTHQPVEQLLALRAIPGLIAIRPADANETVAAWRVAVGRSGACRFSIPD